MADGFAERTIREILDHSEFTYQKRHYKIIQNEKPSPETKTDFYILAEDLKNGTTKEFKISYKKNNFSFVENKIQPHRIKIIYGKNWSHILQEQISQQNTLEENIHWRKKKPEESLQNSFLNFPVINFNLQKILLGSRYEIEQLDKTGNRLHAAKITQNITPQIFWGENCRDNMRDALVDGIITKGCGIPDFILIRNPEDIHNANDAFEHILDIQKYAQEHSEMKASFIAQYYRKSSAGWKTEGWSRSFAVWIKWSVVNGKIRGQPIFDRPLEITAKQVFETFCECLNKLGIISPCDDTNFDIETLRGHLTDDTESVG